MASYHLSAQPVKRSEGRCVVAMAAYRAGERLKDERHGRVADYSRRRGVVHAEIMAPEGVPSWILDRASLWNHVEAMEVRRDAQLAREINMALPHELNEVERLSLVRAFVTEQLVSRGMVADFAIHAPVVEKGDDPRNFHVHVLVSLRQAGPQGFRVVKTREWNSKEMLKSWRVAWAEAQNRALGRRGSAARVDHRSIVAQRTEAMDRRPTRHAVAFERLPEIHVGPKARMAAAEAKPVSKDKMTGRLRRHLVRYTSIDHGSRGERNIARLASNIGRLGRSANRIDLLAARFRKRAVHYARQVSRYENATTPDDRAKLAHARARGDLVAWFIRELDQLFFELLHIQESRSPAARCGRTGCALGAVGRLRLRTGGGGRRTRISRAICHRHATNASIAMSDS